MCLNLMFFGFLKLIEFLTVSVFLRNCFTSNLHEKINKNLSAENVELAIKCREMNLLKFLSFFTNSLYNKNNPDFFLQI